MREEAIIDTNVLIVANGRLPEQASLRCRLACIEALERIRDEGIVLLDSLGHVLREYVNELSDKGEPRTGFEFYKYLRQHCYDPERCRQVEITSCSSKEYEEFPDEPDLAKFDRKDRKWVAIAIASGSTPLIYNAVDCDWVEFEEALARNSIRVKQLCPDAVEACRKKIGARAAKP